MRRPTGHLTGMYGLLFVLLGAIGLNAGWITTMAYGIGDHVVFDACMANAGTWWPTTDLAAAEATRDELAACLRPVTTPWALIMVAGALIAYAVTALLAVAGAVRMRRLIRAAGRATGPAVDAAVARFTQLCQEHGVAGRRPVLHVLRPGARFAEPFTTGGPDRRPMVVVPAAVAARPAVLESVVRHELAHVQARDVLLAAGAWWSGWTGVLLAVVAAAPFLDPGRDTAPGYGTGVLVSVVLGGVLLLQRAHVLRLRELAADRAAAVRSGRPADLADLLVAAPGPARPPGRLRSLLAVHPDTASRARSLSTGAPGIDAGFLPSAVTALVLFIAVQPAYQLVLQWFGWAAGPSSKRLFAVGAALLAVALMPGWVRRYAADPRAPWWPPVVGVAVGGSAGFFLPGPGLPNSPGTLTLSGNWAAGPLLLLAFAGIAVLLVGLARGVDPYRRRDLVAATVAAAGVAAVTVPAPVDALMAWAGGTAPTFVRTAILYGTALSDAEPVIVFAAVAVFAVIAARSAPRPRPAPNRVGMLLTAVTVVAVTTGIAVTMLRLSPDGDRVVDLPLVWHRWWVSALAGGVVLVVLLARSPAGRPLSQRLSGALTAAAGVTAVAAIAQFIARVVATGWDPAYHPGLLGQYLTVPLRLLLLLSVVAAPVGLAVAAAAARWPQSKRAVPLRLRTPLATATAVVLCAAVMFGMGETVTGGVADARRIAQAAPSSSAPPTIPPSAPPPTPGVLTPARARRAVAAAGAQLPGWSENPALMEESEESSCAAKLGAPPPTEPDVEATMAYSADAKHQPPTGAHVLVTVESYRRKPDAEDVFAPMRREVEACRSYTEPSADTVDGRSHFRLSVRDPGSVGHPAFGFGLVRTDRVTQTLSGVTTAHAVTVVAGHHVVSVAVIYSHIGEPPERRMAALDGIADGVLDTVTRQVGR